MPTRRTTLQCRALKHAFDGHVFEEMNDGYGTVWIAHLDCQRACGVRRIDTLNPDTGKLLTRRYKRDDETYDTTIGITEARRLLFRMMLEETRASDST